MKNKWTVATKKERKNQLGGNGEGDRHWGELQRDSKKPLVIWEAGDSGETLGEGLSNLLAGKACRGKRGGALPAIGNENERKSRRGLSYVSERRRRKEATGGGDSSVSKYDKNRTP